MDTYAWGRSTSILLRGMIGVLSWQVAPTAMPAIHLLELTILDEYVLARCRDVHNFRAGRKLVGAELRSGPSAFYMCLIYRFLFLHLCSIGSRMFLICVLLTFIQIDRDSKSKGAFGGIGGKENLPW